MKKNLYIVLGFLTFGLGTIGIVIPILPTTPFLLVASFCFVRGSERINRWFIGTSIYKQHLEQFIKERTMTRKQKVCILTFATILILIPYVLVNNLYMRITIGVIIASKWYYFLFKIKTR